MDIPEAMIETQTRQMLDDFARRMQSQGLSMEQYMQFTGATVDSLKEQMNRRLLRESRADWYLRKLQSREHPDQR